MAVHGAYLLSHERLPCLVADAHVKRNAEGPAYHIFIDIFYIYIDMTSSPKRRSKSIAVDWTAAGRRVRELRGFDMTQREFADRIGISQAYLSNVEHGKVEVGAEILLRIAREFGRTIEWLLTGEDRP